ncbi:CPBP family intramembrane glutamic endopeptidase [uncultured Tenacibaculum sp.]|uniref:CPBP family intramembrane glutamic endopeptidase n=1 Tax=uncultured Tenacibaculum sp. TaxID=174713 RepID=UPI00262637BF|nr:CPBP family intramembrane glutamic endopeptidase [uncultured Tenacibaculum sp.]
MNYIQQAFKGRNEWYLYLISIFLVLFGWQIIGGIPLLISAAIFSDDMGDFAKAAENNFLGIGIDSNLYLFLMILMFIFGLLALIVCIKYIHKRKFTTLVTSRKKIDWKRFWFAFVIWAVIAIVITAVGILISPENYTWNFKPIPFFTLVLVSFLFLPFQTSFEELLFRGYLLQGFGVLFKNRWVPLIITSVVFGLLHGANPEVEKLGYISMVFYIGTGLFFGMLTLLDEGTELALGFHAANNIIAAVFVTANWTVFQTEALYVDHSEPSVGIEMFLPVFVIYPAIIFFLSKKYGWTNMKDKLFGNITVPVAQENIVDIKGVEENAS